MFAQLQITINDSHIIFLSQGVLEEVLNFIVNDYTILQVNNVRFYIWIYECLNSILNLYYYITIYLLSALPPFL